MSRSGPMLLIFALTLFASALLLFLVQPLIGKLIVPLMGGFPAVWNTCMVFFQAMLLAGYAYAHYSTAWLGERRQAVLHMAVLLIPCVVLPLRVFTDLVPTGDANPVTGLLLLLLVSVGLPFFAVSTSAPLLQRWFANTDHPAARDPYFLYAASNVGSMLALLGYPLLMEPTLTLGQQRLVWTVGYGALVALIGLCALLLWKSNPAPVPAAVKSAAAAKAHHLATAVTAEDSFRVFTRDLVGPSLAARSLMHDADEVSWGRVARWVALAFVPSSLMLGVTTYITTDIAAIPLLWVLPLALYLLSFILVFSRLPAVVHKAMVLALPVLLLLLIFVMISRMRTQMWMAIVLHLLVLFAVAMVCHGELARTRPPARHLTKFYLWMSFGGVLGGMFNALLAPVLFTTLAEYPIAIALAGLMLPRMDDERGGGTRSLLYDLALPVGLAIIAVEMFNGFRLSHRLLGGFPATVGGWVESAADSLSIREDQLRMILTFAPAVVLCYIFVERPLRFGLGLAVLFLASLLPALFDKQVIYRDRSFFGTLAVKAYDESYLLKEGDEEERVTVREHRLMHGNILHGVQFRDESYREIPISYYHASGPVGQMMAAFEGPAAKTDIAVIGLGTGTMAAYARPDRRVTFYEIDRKVKEISFDQDPYFSFVQDAKRRGAEVNIVLGDARLVLDRERASKPDQKYDIIVVDAFSSDAIPVHLMTKEALGIYLDKIKPDGFVAFHTSNRYLDLEPEVALIAAHHGCVALNRHDNTNFAHGKAPTTKGLIARYSETEEPAGISASTWVLVARDKAHFGKLVGEASWEILQPAPGVAPWGDDFSNLLRAFQWGSQ